MSESMMVGGKEVTCALCRILTMSCLHMLWFCRENRKPEYQGRGYFVSQLSAIKAVQNMCALTNLNWSLEPRALVTPQMRDSTIDLPETEEITQNELVLTELW